jgi:hypothetical protein
MKSRQAAGLIAVTWVVLATASCSASDSAATATKTVTATVTTTVTATPTEAVVDQATCDQINPLFDRALKVVSGKPISIDEFASAMGAANELRDLADQTTDLNLSAALTAFAASVDASTEAAADKVEFNTTELTAAGQAVATACGE